MEQDEGPDGLVRAYRRARWGSIAVVWGAIFMFDATRHCIDAYLGGREPSTAFLTVAGASLALWAAVTPLMLWLGRRAPLDLRSQIAGSGDPDGAAGGAGGSAPRGINLRSQIAGSGDPDGAAGGAGGSAPRGIDLRSQTAGGEIAREGRAHSLAIHGAALASIIVVDAALQRWLWGDRGRSTVMSLSLALLIIDGFSYATVIAIGHVQRSNALYRERVRAQAALDRELTTARLRALEMQLQPHFLFNTLHAVGALIRSARLDDAVRSLATLGGLLRATLDGGDQHEIALVDEIALAHRYLALQKIRFADRLQVTIVIAPEVERARVPRLILQPLLENAVRHGVEQSRTAVAIEIRALRRRDQLWLVVRDHGGVREASRPGHGIGLANTRARLAALYGAAHRLEQAPTEGGGLAIRIEIPLVVAPAQAGPPPAARELELEGDLAEPEAAT